MQGCVAPFRTRRFLQVDRIDKALDAALGQQQAAAANCYLGTTVAALRAEKELTRFARSGGRRAVRTGT